MIGLWIVVIGCSAPPEVTARAVPGGFDLRADAPISRLEVRTSDGAVVLRRRFAVPTSEAWVDAAWRPESTYRFDAVTERGSASASVVTPAVSFPVAVELEAPLGQGARAIGAGDRVTVATVEGAAIDAGLVLTAIVPGTIVVRFGDREHRIDLAAAGQRQVVVQPVTGPTEVSVVAGTQTIRFELDVRPIAFETAARELALAEIVFPADGAGDPDEARPSGRVTLPARWWEVVLEASGLGFRPSDAQAAWGNLAVALRNTSEDAANVVVRMRVVDEAGHPARAFRPRIREANGELGFVDVLLRLPAEKGATAVLPLFVDRSIVRPGAYRAEIEVTALGTSRPLHLASTPVYVVRGSGWASLGFGASLAAAAVGVGGIVTGLRGWLARARTSDLTTVALFGSIQFVVAVVSQLAATVATSLIGPFSSLLTGLVDEAVRAALLTTLLTLLPRPGVATVSLLVGQVLRVLVLGMFTPLDAVFVGASVTWLEVCLYLAGLTRDGRWRDEPIRRRWLRLSAGIATASVLSAASAMAVHVVFYRLFYAGWFVAMVLAIPSFVYVVVACRLAVPFADALRRVEP